MFARIVKSSLKPNHTSEFNELFEKQVIPMLRKAKGFKDVIALTGPNGFEAVSITLWDSKEDADTYGTESFQEVLKSMASVLDGSPQVKTYEVGNSTFHQIAAPAAV